MFIPKHFEISDEDEIFRFIQANAFGQLISQVEGRPFATHLPFLLSADKTTLIAHLAKKNPQHNDIENQEVLITLQGEHDYISPSWYEKPGVPTWNYQAVHIYGTAKTFSDTERLKNVVDQLTAKYEAGFERPWQPDYNPAMLNAIIGVEITITDIQCKYKLSQNRSAEDRANVITELSNNGAEKLAKAMTNNEK